MALHIRDAKADRLVRQLAAMKKIGLTEAVILAVENEVKRAPLAERIRPIQDRIASWPSTGLVADKAFYDELSGEE